MRLPHWPAPLTLRRRRRRRSPGEAVRTNEQLERSHEARKLAVTEANKHGMGFNGL